MNTTIQVSNLGIKSLSANKYLIFKSSQRSFTKKFHKEHNDLIGIFYSCALCVFFVFFVVKNLMGQIISQKCYTTYVEAAVFPPLPVQLVWKNSPRGLSIRS